MNRKLRLWGTQAAAVIATGPGVALLAHAQTPAARLQFEVATIKPSTGGSRSSMGMNRSGDFDAKNMSLKSLIAEAYRVKTFEVYGGSGWIGSDPFDITAKPSVDHSAGSPSEADYSDLQLRLQTLLEDRFALKVHRETKELPVYALVVVKSGLKVKPSDCQAPDGGAAPSSPAPGQSSPAFCGNTRVSRDGQNLVMTGTGITMADLLRILSRETDRVVIDKSGYTETFNATLEWAPNQGGGNAPAPDGNVAPPADTTGVSLFTALQEQLGLKLESTKGPVDVVVIDHVEKPTPN